MAIILGPVLGFRGREENGNWRTSALVVTDDGDSDPPGLSLMVDGERIEVPEPKSLKSFGEFGIWRYEWGVKQTERGVGRIRVRTDR